MEGNNREFESIQSVDTKLRLAEQRLDTLSANVESSLKELRSLVTSLDKDIAVQEEKQLRIMLQIDQLEKSVEVLSQTNVKKQDGSNDFIKSVLIAVISSGLAYIWSKMT